MDELPTVVTSAGMQPIPPVTIQQNLLAQCDAIIPGMETRLPGILMENITSVDTLAIIQCDAARIETVNSLTPKGANEWLLKQLGDIYGIKIGETTNTSVQVVFTGPPGFVIQPGFLVSDGVYQYSAVDGGIIGSGGQSSPLFFIAVLPGTWSIPAGTVTGIATSVPLNIQLAGLTCSNPYPGTPSVAAESETSFRARTLTAGLASAQGMPAFLKTQIANVSGVQPRLIAFQQQIGGGWKIIVGGNADPYEIAWAIYRGIADISSLVESFLWISNISQGPNCVVTTTLNHGFSTGQVARIYGITNGMLGIVGQALTVTVIDEKTFSTDFDSTSAGPYQGGGYVTPNFRNNTPAIQDYPDNYVVISVIWNTIEENVINGGAVDQLASVALAKYVNDVPVGQPMNEFVMTRVFQDSVASILPSPLITRLIFEVSINGVGTALTPGTGEFQGDPESYFYADPTGVGMTILQG